MAVIFTGAIVISANKEYKYTIRQRIINGLVSMAPRLLGRFRQSPEIIKTESFTRDGVSLTPKEIEIQKSEMVKDALNQFHNPYASLEESRTGKMHHATVSFTAEGMKTIKGEEFDPLEEKMKEIDSISDQARSILKLNGLPLDKITISIYRDNEPLKMAHRVAKIMWLMDNFTFSQENTQKMCDTLRQFASKNAIAETLSHSEMLHRHAHLEKIMDETCSASFKSGAENDGQMVHNKGIPHSRIKPSFK